MNDAKLTDCPLEECEGPVKRLLGTGAGIVFKGGGVYETDYRSKSYNDSKKADSKPAESKESKSSDAKPSSSGDSKPAASTPPAKD